MNNIRTLLAVVAAATLSIGGCNKADKKAESEPKATEGGTQAPAGEPAADLAAAAVIQIDGSSTVFPITQAVAEEYQKAKGGKVTVGVSGTGGGFKKFCRDEIAIAGASRPIKDEEQQACKAAGIEFIELPVAYDGLAVMVNPQNDWVDKLTVEELKTIWAPEAQGKITKWSQVRKGWPDKDLRLFGAGVDSGTYDYFTQAIVGKEHASRGDFTSSEDDNVLVQGISTDPSGLGFFGYAYYIENKDKLKLVPIDDGKDENGKGAIAPSPETVANGTYQPLSRPIFIYVSSKAMARPEVKAFVEFYLTDGISLVNEVGYIALPAKAYELARKRFTDGKTGSVFHGSKVGVTVEELLSGGA
jgi:phosphate transport system substrate-binding protein